MDPVLIFTDTERINKEKAFLAVVVPYLQGLYNDFKAMAVTITLADLVYIHNSAARSSSYGLVEEGASADPLYNVVKDKLVAVAMAGQPNFGGVPISPERVRDMIEVPDFSPIREKIALFYRDHVRDLAIRANLLVLANDVIGKAAGADAVLEQEFSYYTRSDRSAQFANALLAVIATLPNFEQAYIQQMAMTQPYKHNSQVIPGIRYQNNQYVLDLNFIRQRERELGLN